VKGSAPVVAPAWADTKTVATTVPLHTRAVRAGRNVSTDVAKLIGLTNPV
jgi:hypothetical protein